MFENNLYVVCHRPSKKSPHTMLSRSLGCVTVFINLKLIVKLLHIFSSENLS